MYKKIYFSLLALSFAFAFLGTCVRWYRHGFFAKTDFFDAIEENTELALPGGKYLREIYGIADTIISPRENANASGSATVKDEDGFLQTVGYLPEFDFDQAANDCQELNDFCKNAGIDFMYVSYPSKIDATYNDETFGIGTNQEAYREYFLTCLSEKGIPLLDVRSLLEKDGYTNKDVFYKTDHHWKFPFGFYGARAIVHDLNENFDEGLDENLLSDENFDFVTYKNLWLGETGRSVSYAWVRTLDDFVDITPKFETSFTAEYFTKPEEGEKTGDFSILRDDVPEKNDDLYSYSAHYTYAPYTWHGAHIHNNLIRNGRKIVIIKDSFSVAVIPFLAYVASDVYVWDQRSTEDSLYDFLNSHSVDTVLMAYTDYWDNTLYHVY